jgi:hypothetical protein
VTRGRLESVIAIAALAAAVPLLATVSGAQNAVRYVPANLTDTAWLAKLKAAQVKAMATVGAFHDFQFTDHVADTGITFKHHIVDDAGRTYKAAHYDHGNGLAVADVDGDGLLDIYFVSQTGGNQLWRNLGGGRFENITAAAGVAVPDKISVSASFADIDNDGDQDLYVTTVRGGNMLFENDGHGHFKDISAAAGVNYTGHSSSAVFFDYDHDGRLDLFLVNVGKYTTDTVAGDGYKYFVAFDDSGQNGAFWGHLHPERAEPSVLYHNAGNNHFVDVTDTMGLRDLSWSGDATVLDGNEDGWPDLYLLNMQGDDQYYENDHGAKFVKRSRELFPKTSWGAMGVKAFDYNNDGHIDLLITDMHSDMSAMTPPEFDHLKSDMKWPVEFRGSGKTSIWGNTFFQKDGPNRYHEVSDKAGLENYCPWGPSVGDLNADGFLDVFIASGMNYPERYMPNSIKLNDAGKTFADAEFAVGVEPRQGGIATPFFELDASGRDKDHKDAVGETGKVTVWGARASRSSAIFDVDGDGDLDIVTNEFNAAPMVLISNLTAKTRVHYLQVALAGTTSNRNGLGAVVRVVAGGRTYTQVMDGNSGYLSHSVMPLYFGLGASESVDRIEVSWPSGKSQTVSAPKINSTVTVREQ